MQPWMQQAHALEAQFGIPQGLYVALIRQESGGNPNAVSPVGAIGYAQLMPGTAAGMGINPHNPAENLRGGAMYLSNALKRYNNNIGMALASYNAGPGAVAKYNGIPPYAETRNYVRRVQALWGRNGAQAGPSTAQGLAGPQGAVQGPQGDPVALSNQINRIQNAYVDSPDLAAPHIDKLQAAFQGGLDNPAHAAPGLPGMAEGKGFFARRAGETGQQYLDRLLQKKFGLQHDPGNAQTTGGRHAEGSGHYRGTATDFGDARNDPALLQQAENWLENNASNIQGGLKLSWYGSDDDPSGAHNDHFHAETYRAMKPNTVKMKAPPSIKPANSRRRPVKRVRTAV